MDISYYDDEYYYQDDEGWESKRYPSKKETKKAHKEYRDREKVRKNGHRQPFNGMNFGD